MELSGFQIGGDNFTTYTADVADKLSEAFGRPRDNIDWLVERDTRTFPEVLSAWMDYEGATSVAAFLTQIRVNEIIELITEKQFRNLHDGIQVAGPRMATVIAMHLPDGVMRPEKQRTFYPKFYGFQNNAARWRESGEGKFFGDQPITQLELEPHKFEDFSAGFLDTLCTAPRAVPLADTEESGTPEELPQAGDILVALESFAAQQSRTRGYDAVSVEEILENLNHRYRSDPYDAIKAIGTLLQTSGARAVTDDEIEIFLQSSNPVSEESSAPARALFFLRKIYNLTLTELGEMAGVTAQSLHHWEHGSRPISPNTLKKLIQAFKLSSAECKPFILLVRSDIILNVGEAWLDARIEYGEWDKISLPALDIAWLDAQPWTVQPGLLLRDLRVQKRLTQKQLAESIKSDQSIVSGWERAEEKIPHTKLGELASMFEAEQAKQLILLVRPEIIQHLDQAWLAEQIEQKRWNNISFPALHGVWLNAQPPDKRPGLLLRDLRLSEQLTQEQLGHMVGVEGSAVGRWESGERAIPWTKLGKLAAVFTATEAKQLIVLVRPEIIERASASWLDAKVSKAEWEKVSFPALDKDWLSAQPEYLQAGLLFRAFRERASQRQGTLVATQEEFSSLDVIILERGGRPIAESMISALQKSANLSAEEVFRLREAVARSSVASQALGRRNKAAVDKEIMRSEVRALVEHFGSEILPPEACGWALRRCPVLLVQQPQKLIENIEAVYFSFAESGLKLSSYLKAATVQPQLFTQSPETIMGNVNQIIALYKDGVFRLPEARQTASSGKPLEALLEWLCHNPSWIVRSQENTFLRYLLFADQGDIPLPARKVFLGGREEIEGSLVTKFGLNPDEHSIASNRLSAEALRQMTSAQRAKYLDRLPQEHIRNLAVRALLRIDEIEAEEVRATSGRGRKRDPRILTRYRIKAS